MFGPLGRAAVLLAHLRPLYRPRLSHADIRRHPRRPRARPAPHHPAWRDPDGDRPFHDGVRAAVPVRPDRADSRQRRVQAQYFGAGRRALCARRSAARPRLFDLLRRDQCRRASWRRWSAARSARSSAGTMASPPPARHDDRACDLSLRLADTAAGRIAQGDGQRASRRAARPQRMARHPRADRAVRADDLVLGHLRAARQHHRAVGRRLYRPARSISSSGAAKSRSPGFRPSILS